MSATELRETVRRKIDHAIMGDGKESGGVANTIISGAPRDYQTYRDLCGYVRGLNHALAFMDEAFAEMHGDASNPLDDPEGKT